MTIFKNKYQNQTTDGGVSRSRTRLPWVLLILFLLFLLVLAALTGVVWRYEQSETQRQQDRELSLLLANMRTQMLGDVRSVQISGNAESWPADLLPISIRLGQDRAALHLIELHRPGLMLRSLFRRPGNELNAMLAQPLPPESRSAAETAARKGEITFASSYFLSLDTGGAEMLEAWVPLQGGVTDSNAGASVRMVYKLAGLLGDLIPYEFASTHEITLREVDGTVLAWGSGLRRGSGVFKSNAIFDLPGSPMVLHVNNESDGPRLIPNVLSGMVLALGLALIITLWRLIRDMRQRAVAEAQLRQEFSFRKAMENSLSTGLRARDLNGRVIYVNPAFCAMTGFDASDLIDQAPPMPYWAPEAMKEYERRFAQVIAGTITQEGFETTFMRRSGERFPALIYEAPLIDSVGKQTGWMGSILDLTERRHIEQINQQQQQQLERAARLATMGELASVLSHELNQPLSAIASYATGAGNLLERSASKADLSEALSLIQEQAQRAGSIIHRVHDFIRRREEHREAIDLVQVVRTVQALVLLQSSPLGVRIAYQLPNHPVKVVADRVMIEQVILNLTRNAIQALTDLPLERRQVEFKIELSGAQNVQCSVIDHGPGVAPDIAPDLFGMYVTTKAEGMGIGLNICRTVIERFGGSLWHEPTPGGGASFIFTMPLDINPAQNTPTETTQ